MAWLAQGQTSVITVKIGARSGYKIVSENVQNVLAPMGIEIIWVSVQNILACKYIAPMAIEVVSVSVKKCSCMYKYIVPMGIEDTWASVQNILACKYIAPMGIEVVLASVKNVLVNVIKTALPKSDISGHFKIRAFQKIS